MGSQFRFYSGEIISGVFGSLRHLSLKSSGLVKYNVYHKYNTINGFNNGKEMSFLSILKHSVDNWFHSFIILCEKEYFLK